MGALVLVVPRAGEAGFSLAGGPVLKVGVGGRPDYVGARGHVDGDYFGIGVERYDGPEANRTRGELSFRIPIPVGRAGAAIEPQVGLMPVDYLKASDGRAIYSVYASATIRARVPLSSRVGLLIEPFRLEARFLRATIPSSSDASPVVDTDLKWEHAAAASLAFRW